VWAVGRYYNYANVYETLILHWDGSLWSIVPSPSPGTGTNSLQGVAAVSANDVWAVGFYGGSGMGRSLTMHWDGSAWNVTPTPEIGTDGNMLLAVDAASGDDVWAVGSYDVPSNGSHTLVLHWDGSSWAVVPSPSVGTDNNQLYGISVISANDIWAVGYHVNSSSAGRTLILHWNGSIWEIIPSPNVGNDYNQLYGVDAASDNDAWAVGTYVSNGLNVSLVMHWDGSIWSVTPSPNVGIGDMHLGGVATVSTHDAWIIGAYYGATHEDRTLVERYGPCQSACSLSFEDVPPNNDFYSYIECLACQGIIGGYPCGGSGEPCNPTNDPYFRPGNNVTRGQFAKIIANAAGFNETPGAQQYEDVVPGSTFYNFIWRLSDRGYINGYPCGGAGEPCGSNNLPYFRPNSNISRGQIAKIDSNAAGYNDTPGAQRYEDVLPGSTFYDFIWRLSDRGLVNGYPCGGTGEPCGPNNLPYFRPSANATRGQASKIVSNTFFPNCQTHGSIEK